MSLIGMTRSALTSSNPDATGRYYSILISFVMVFGILQALVYHVTISSMLESPSSTGWLLLIRALPSFFVGWVVGFAADYHRTKLLNLGILGLGMVVFFVHPSVGILFAGIIVAWAEISLGALLSEIKHQPDKGVHVGLAFDVAKLLGVPFIMVLLYLTIGPWIMTILLLVGILALGQGYHTRPSQQNVQFRPKANVLIPTIAVAIFSIGLGGLLWVQGFLSRDSVEFYWLIGGFALGAIIGNLILLRINDRTYAVSMIGCALTLTGFLLAYYLDTPPYISGLFGMMYGTGAAVMYQSLRCILLSDSIGRDQSLFITTSRVMCGVGGVLLSALLPYVSIIILVSGLLTLSVMLYGQLRHTGVHDSVNPSRSDGIATHTTRLSGDVDGRAQRPVPTRA